MLDKNAVASYTPVGLTERYSAPAVDSEPTNTFWHYNSARQLDHLIKPDGTVISNVYDSAGRLVGVRRESGSSLNIQQMPNKETGERCG